MRKWFIIKQCHNRVIWFAQTYRFNNALWFIVINWYNRLHDSFKKYDTYYHFLILSEIWILSAFPDQSKDHVTNSIIVSLISNDTSNVHWLITMIWYNIYWWFDRWMLIQVSFLVSLYLIWYYILYWFDKIGCYDYSIWLIMSKCYNNTKWFSLVIMAHFDYVNPYW